MDIHRMQELMQIYDEKLDTPDYSYIFEARWAYVTSDWIRSLDMEDRACIFEYIGYILNQKGESLQKQRSLMMLAMFPCQETEKLMNRFL